MEGRSCKRCLLSSGVGHCVSQVVVDSGIFEVDCKSGGSGGGSEGGAVDAKAQALRRLEDLHKWML